MDVVDAAAKLMGMAGKITDGVTEAIASNDELRERVDRIPAQLGPYGVDAFGFDPQYLKKYIGLSAWMYRHYFRCSAFGLDNLPEGRCLVVANHSGQLPWDAVMVTMAGFLDHEPPRFLRSMIERFVPNTPFVSPFLARCGQILGTPENCRRLLAADEAILVFPEGVRGLSKTWGDRYKLQRFGQGFMRLAIETEAPILPCAVIGAEEQAPTAYNVRSLGRLLGVPALPLTVAPAFGVVPLPTRYRIHFGKAMTFEGNANDEDQVILRKIDQVKAAVQRLLDKGLEEREHIFW